MRKPWKAPEVAAILEQAVVDVRALKQATTFTSLLLLLLNHMYSTVL